MKMDNTKIFNNITNNTVRWIISGLRRCKYNVPESDLEENAKRVAVILLVAFGLAGNIFVIILAVKYTARKNLHHLIINMAVSDNLFIIMSLLDIIQWLISKKSLARYPDGILGDFLCKARAFLYEVSYKVSLLTLLVISIERFRATRQTLQRFRPYKMKKRLAVVFVCWVVPMVIEAYRWHYQKKLANGQCAPHLDDIFKYFRLVTACVNVLVMISIFTLSISTIRRLSRRQNIHNHLNQEQQNRRIHRTKAAVRMVLASTLLTACCWLPVLIFFSLIRIAVTAGAEIVAVCIDWRSFTFIAVVFLPLFNSCFSPCIYFMFLSDFRKAASSVLCSLFRRNDILPAAQPRLNQVIELEERRRIP